ncbi:hypothetical protein BC835DRAFT_1298874 [Cytidiella melzeri]|nr:hypothetical protein BC835DRAFT_1298874 [Cytidiella melzeri]
MFTAESYTFWFMYIAPHLLKGRFRHIKYYTHFEDLVNIMKATLLFEITHNKIINKVEAPCREWVAKYEEYYYQYEDFRLDFCVLPIHGLLHIADDIRTLGPMSVTWTFYLERYCGFLKRELQSRSQPWRNIDIRLQHFARLSQLQVLYDLKDLKLLLDPQSILQCPKQVVPASDTLRMLIARYLHSMVPKPRQQIAAQLSDQVVTWAGVRVQDGGDRIRCAEDCSRLTRLNKREGSYVRYEVAIGYDSRMTIYYGRLETIIDLTLPETPDNDIFWEDHQGCHVLLALITPCATSGTDGAKEAVSFRQEQTKVVVDLRTITNKIGRVETRGRWGIIDRSTGMARTVFVDLDVSLDKE